MSSDPFASAEAKRNRGRLHTQAFNAKAGETTNRDAYEVLQQAEPNTRRVSIRFKQPLDKARDELALILGDAVHNYRSALDHLVYAFGVLDSGMTPPPDENRLSFPIADSPAEFDKQRWHFKSLAPRSQAFVEKHQSYKRGHDPDADFLPRLALLDDLDKHRLLHPTVVSSSSVEVIAPPGPQGDIDLRMMIAPLDQQTEAAVIIADWIGPNDNLQVLFTLHVGLRDVPAWKESCVDVLAGIDRRVDRIIGAARHMLAPGG